MSKEGFALIRDRIDEITEKVLSAPKVPVTTTHIAYVMEILFSIWEEVAQDNSDKIKAARLDELRKISGNVLSSITLPGITRIITDRIAELEKQ